MESYDEFGMFRENVVEAGLSWNGPPAVAREQVEVGGGRSVSALVWGTAPPEIVFLHGGGQNAHTWDTVALALDRPVLAIDLPGHGHSDWRDDGDYSPRTLADDVSVAVAALAPDARAVVGMSLGGLTAIALAASRPEIVRRLLVVDVTPGVNEDKAKAVIDFMSGPETFPSFDEILARTVQYNPTRSESSLRRGILHNARRRDDGSWAWRYDRRRREGISSDGMTKWEDVASTSVPLLLVRGGDSPVVGDDDIEMLSRTRPDATVEIVAGAGHSVQGDRPVELAGIVERFVDDG